MQCVLLLYQLIDFKLTKTMISLHLFVAKIIINHHQKTQLTNSFEILPEMYLEN